MDGGADVCSSANRAEHFIGRGVSVIKYLGTKKNEDGAVLYCFIVNGQKKEVREFDLKMHPGCYAVLPQAIKDQISKNRQWLSKAN